MPHLHRWCTISALLDLALGCLCAVTLGCAPDHEPEVGDALLDAVNRARVVRLPHTNLPPGVLDGLSSTTLLRIPIPQQEWLNAGMIPEELRHVLASHPGTRYWEARPSLGGSAGGSVMQVLLDGAPAPTRTDAQGFEGLAVWWSSDDSMVTTGTIVACCVPCTRRWEITPVTAEATRNGSKP